jgi:hypothetical protein
VPSEQTPNELTRAARTTQLRNAAIRSVDDPVTLARAARIVRAALARQRLTPADLTGDIVKPSDLGGAA